MRDEHLVGYSSGSSVDGLKMLVLSIGHSMVNAGTSIIAGETSLVQVPMFVANLSKTSVTRDPLCIPPRCHASDSLQIDCCCIRRRTFSKLSYRCRKLGLYYLCILLNQLRPRFEKLTIGCSRQLTAYRTEYFLFQT